MSSEDPLERALRTLTPDARAALRRAVERALGHAVEPTSAASIVNTDAETASVPLDAERQRALVARASTEGAGAPVVRLDDGEAFALLISPEHFWTLADRVDELEVALRTLATAVARGFDSPERLEWLLARLGT
jgi:hypothetical protein